MTYCCYYVELDYVNDIECGYFYANDWNDLTKQVTNALTELGGGHADIWDDEGEYIDDLEV